MRFRKRGKLSHLFIGPLKILEHVLALVLYILTQPDNLSSVHPAFHVLMLKRNHGDGEFIIKWNSIVLDKDLQYEDELISILDRYFQKLRTKDIKFVKVRFNHRPIEEDTRKTEKDMQDIYP